MFFHHVNWFSDGFFWIITKSIRSTFQFPSRATSTRQRIGQIKELSETHPNPWIAPNSWNPSKFWDASNSWDPKDFSVWRMKRFRSKAVEYGEEKRNKEKSWKWANPLFPTLTFGFVLMHPWTLWVWWRLKGFSEKGSPHFVPVSPCRRKRGFQWEWSTASARYNFDRQTDRQT